MLCDEVLRRNESIMSRIWVNLKWFLFTTFVGNLCGAIGWSFRTQAAFLRNTEANPFKDPAVKVPCPSFLVLIGFYTYIYIYIYRVWSRLYDTQQIVPKFISQVYAHNAKASITACCC